MNVQIGDTTIGPNKPTYFIADIAANHDGDINRAIELIHRCAEAGANAAKFQNFKASTIVSDVGFKKLGKNLSHQSEWDKSVYEVYNEASISLEWTSILRDTCKSVGINYFTSPYDLSILNHLNDYVQAWKIGSGDITWPEMIEELAKKDKPLLIATGASNEEEVDKAMQIALKFSKKVVIMQCNTNYTGSRDNFKYINLNVLKEYARKYPNCILGLSDHTPGNTTVLGAIALGARVIEKHFTDDCTRIGPDHKFSMDPVEWKDMVIKSRDLEAALGDGHKRIEDNELETVILQRRSLRANSDLATGTIISRKDIVSLRPCPNNSFTPNDIHKVLGKKLNRNIEAGDIISIEYLDD